MSILISYILPCYNVAPYIGRCLESIEHQDIPMNEFEIICGDGCSTDQTVETVRSYQEAYSNIKLYCHSENQTAGGARNTGIDHANGEYLWFVDPDDAIKGCIVGCLYSIIDTHNLDALYFSHESFNENGSLIETTTKPSTNQTLTGISFIEYYYPGKLSDLCTIWNVLYRRQFLLDKGILYPCIKASQDVVFAWKALLQADKVRSVDIIGYQYYKRPESTTGKTGRHKADKIISRTILFPIEIERIRKDTTSGVIQEDLARTIRWCVNDLLFSLSKATKDERRKYYGFAFLHKDEVLGLRDYMSRATKLLLMSFPPFYVWDIRRAGLQLVKHVGKH